MKKINILQKNADFDRIIKNGNPFKYKYFIIYKENNNNNFYHFGFSVGKKVGNAVTRNRIRRQLKCIIDKNQYQEGFNCIIIVGKSILEESFSQIETNLLTAIDKLNIIKEKK